MEEFPVRPVISGLVGAGISIWLTSRWAKWVPDRRGAKGASTLLAENRWRIFIANTLFFASLIVGVAAYRLGYIPSTDFRGLGLAFGLSCVAPVVFLFVSTAYSGLERTREAFVAYAINQRTPPVVLYGIVALGFVAFFVTVASYADA